MDNSSTLRRLALAIAVVVSACGSGAPGNQQGRPTSFSEPPPASNLQERAAKGLAISPVPIDTARLSAADQLKVGIGSYIVNGPGLCTACHTSQAGHLAGGNPFSVGPGQMVFSRNLTPDPDTGMQLNEWQFLDTLRTGRDRHGKGDKMLVVMPWLYFRWMSEADIHAIYAYLKLIPAVKNAVPPDVKDALPVPPALPPPERYTDGEVTRELHYNGDYFPPLRGFNISARELTHESADDSVGTGAYIVNAMSHCNDCHTDPARTADNRKIETEAFLSGGTVFAVPPPLQPVFHQVRTMSANLKGETHGFFNEPNDSFTRFSDLIHSGTHVDESPARPLGFPMNEVAGSLAKLIDSDLQAVYDYLKLVPNVTGAADAERQPWAAFCSQDSDCGGGQTCSTGTHECVGRSCTADTDCAACQTCGNGTCQAPAAGSACVASARQ